MMTRARVLYFVRWALLGVVIGTAYAAGHTVGEAQSKKATGECYRALLKSWRQNDWRQP